MKNIHVECLPDETLVKKLGFTRKAVTHHTGKSRVFAKLGKANEELALVDEDPGSARTTYESNLIRLQNAHGITQLQDKTGNKVHILEGKLEDWIIKQCRVSGIDITSFGLSDKPNQLHSEINQRLQAFERLIDELIKQRNPGILKLKEWLQ